MGDRRGYNELLPYVKINSIVANLTIVQHEPVEREMKTVGFVDFILRNLQDGTDQIFQSRNEEPKSRQSRHLERHS